MDGEALTKGISFVNVKAFTIQRFGQEGYDAVLERLTPADREVLPSVVTIGWYSLALYARLINALEEAHGYGDMALVVQLGRFEAERDLTLIHRVFLRIMNPAIVVEKTGEYWRRFHDTGEWKLTRESPTRLSGTLEGWGCVDEALCRELVGYLTRLMELVGAKNVLIEHPRCRARQQDECFFKARWGTGDAGPDSAAG